MAGERGWTPADDEGLIGRSVDESAEVFAAGLSDDESEDQSESETQQEQESPAPESDEAESEEAEQEDEAEDESDETDEESEEATPEEPGVIDLAKYGKHKIQIPVDGKMVEVTLEEASKGYSREADYTRKSQVNAEERKALAAEKAAVTGQRQQYAQYIDQLVTVVQAATKEPNWAERRQALSTEDYLAERDAWFQHEKELKALTDEQADAHAKIKQDFEAQQEEHMKGEREKFLAAVPEFANPKTAASERAKMAEYATKLGFTPKQLAQVDDHRLLVVLRKARLFDELQAKKPKAEAIITKVRTVKPGSKSVVNKKPMSRETKAHLRLARTGSIQDAAAAFRSQMD
jgi:hypothetical protein